jgi:hypothetical protein
MATESLYIALLDRTGWPKSAGSFSGGISSNSTSTGRKTQHIYHPCQISAYLMSPAALRLVRRLCTALFIYSKPKLFVL